MEISLRALIAGDERVWAALAQQIRRQWRPLSVRYVGEGEADDVLQEVFVRVYTHREEILDTAHLDTLVRRVWNQRVVDHWRRRQVRDRHMLRFHSAEPTSAPPPYLDPASETIRHELLGQIGKCALLSDEQKLILTLRIVDGLSNVEVSRILEENADTVETWYYRAVERLRLEIALSAYREDPYGFATSLSHQQRAALDLLSQGASAKAIAHRMKITVPQVRELLAPALQSLCEAAVARWREYLRGF
ncbi:MAG: RNA polymerase sigma factor [Verrucomicrobiales bacterium]|nr:RNA polymerase sigma factor [Verrucomicrobiales bacterium]MCP5527895.1 RNA polymerase sigma factor [Verrucomicrobiales bacterium]